MDRIEIDKNVLDLNQVQDYADGFKIYHNFIRKGIKDKKTPAERCGIGVNQQNRWNEMMVKSLRN